MKTILMENVQPGNILYFNAYSLRVEKVKILTTMVKVFGRIDVDGSPTVWKTFFKNKEVRIVK